MLRGAPDTYAEQARRRMRLRSRGQGAAPARDAEGVQSEEGTRVATPPGAADGGRERERNGVMPIEWHADVVREEGGSRGGVNRRQLLEDSVTFVPTLAPTPMVGISVPTIPTTPAPTMLPTVLATVLPTIASTMAPSLEPTQPVAEETASDVPQLDLLLLYVLMGLFAIICFLGKFSKRHLPEPAEYYMTPHAGSNRMSDRKKPPRPAENQSKRLGGWGWTPSGRKIGVEVDQEDLSDIAQPDPHTGWTPTGGRNGRSQNSRLMQLEKDASGSRQRSQSPVSGELLKDNSDSVDRRKAVEADEYAKRENERRRKLNAAGGNANDGAETHATGPGDPVGGGSDSAGKNKATARDDGTGTPDRAGESVDSAAAEEMAEVMASLMEGIPKSNSKKRSNGRTTDDGSGGYAHTLLRDADGKLRRSASAHTEAGPRARVKSNPSPEVKTSKTKLSRRATMGTPNDMDKLLDPLYLIPGYTPVGSGSTRKFSSTDYAENIDRRMSGQNLKNIDVKAIQRAMSGADEGGDDPEEDDDEPIVRPKGRYKDDESKSRINYNSVTDGGAEGDEDGNVDKSTSLDNAEALLKEGASLMQSGDAVPPSDPPAE